MEPKVLESLLRRWGRWKQDSVVVGSTGTIEQKFKEQMPFGDGNSVSVPHDGLSLMKPSEDVEKVNAVYMQLLDEYRAEMTLISYVYVFEWSMRHIAGASRSAKATIKNRLQRARNLIEARLGYVSPAATKQASNTPK